MTMLWLLVLPTAFCFRVVASTDTTEAVYADGSEWCSRYLSCSDCIAYSTPSLARRASLQNATESTIQRIMTEERCAWDPVGGNCVDIGQLDTGTDEQHITDMAACRSLREEQLSTFLPNWMGHLLNMTSDPIGKADSGSSSHQTGFGNLTLLDVSLPGTHDTLSYDLSLEISDDGLDMYTQLDYILHYFSGGTVQLVPGDIESFLRDQSMTQRLDVIAQLNGGVRFLDVRIMLEDEGQEWYGVHFMQTYHPALHYMRQVRSWLDEHPLEIVVIWISKHGVPDATGDGQYPGASMEAKNKFWEQYCAIFDGLLLDTSSSAINTTSIGDLIEIDHRVITFATDYVEFTNSSRYALDASRINNWVHGDGAFDEAITLDVQRGYFQGAHAQNRWAKEKGQFNLMGMNTEGTESQILGAFKDRFLKRSFVLTELLGLLRSIVAHLSQFLGIFGELGGFLGGMYLSGLLDSCAKDVNIPDLSDWCPSTLLEVAQLSSYYDQIAIEEAFLASFISPNTVERRGSNPAFPNAFYLDGLDVEGTIRSGLSLKDEADDENDVSHAFTKYAYVDTIVSYNVEVTCRSKTEISQDGGFAAGNRGCYQLRRLVAQRRQNHPLQRWNDAEHGRQEDWPK